MHVPLMQQTPGKAAPQPHPSGWTAPDPIGVLATSWSYLAAAAWLIASPPQKHCGPHQLPNWTTYLPVAEMQSESTLHDWS